MQTPSLYQQTKANHRNVTFFNPCASYLWLWFHSCQCSKLSWWPSWTWPRTLWAATMSTSCSLWVSLELALMEAKMLPALVTSLPCSGTAMSIITTHFFGFLPNKIYCYYLYVLYLCRLQQSSREAAVPTNRLQHSQVPVRWQPEGGARVVHSHHPNGACEWCWGYWDRLGM